MNRLTRAISNAYSSDSKLRATWLLACRAASGLKDWILSKIFDAPQIHIGTGSVFRGSKYMSFGKGIFVNGHLWLEAISHYQGEKFTPKIEIGDFVSLSNGVHISSIEHIVIGKNTLIGSGVYISDHNHGVYKGVNQSRPDEQPSRRRLVGGPVSVGENVWIGDNVVIVGPVTIGDGAVIGANSVIKANVPAETIVAGIPALPIKRFNHLSNSWERV
jgi:acetyltransferase-like isoleucine patch superfamily enzyme